MATLVLRLVKGSPLTNQEVDGNFSNLNTEIGVVNSNVGVLPNLTTTTKANLVNAINEINTKVTNGGTLSGITITNSTWSGNTISIARGGTGATTEIQARTNLGLAIGANVQPWNTNLDVISNITPSNNIFISGNGTNWESTSPASARTKLGLGTIATQNANNVSIIGGNISNGSNINVTTRITANAFIGDGGLLSNIIAGGSGAFNTSISNVTGYEVTTIMANAYSAPSVAGSMYIVHSIHVTNIDGANSANISGQFVGTTYNNISICHEVPVPVGSAVELLNRPKILQPNDYIQLQATANSDLHATITIEQSGELEYFGTGVDVTLPVTYFDLMTATANSVIESILLSNDDGVNDVKSRVVWTDGANNIQGYFAFDMIVPANSTIEILEQPKFIPNGYKIRVYSNIGDRLEAMVSGKRST